MHNKCNNNSSALRLQVSFAISLVDRMWLWEHNEVARYDGQRIFIS